MAMDAAGDAVMDLSRALDTIQKHGRRRKLETEVATHLREAEKRLRCCVALSSSESIDVLFLYSGRRVPVSNHRSSASAHQDDIYLPSTAAYRVLDTAKGASNPFRVSCDASLIRSTNRGITVGGLEHGHWTSGPCTLCAVTL